MPEHFECLDCFHIGPLTIRGKCSRCNSSAVISQQLFKGFKEEESEIPIQRSA